MVQETRRADAGAGVGGRRDLCTAPSRSFAAMANRTGRSGLRFWAPIAAMLALLALLFGWMFAFPW
jgi:hypothetical protein